MGDYGESEIGYKIETPVWMSGFDNQTTVSILKQGSKTVDWMSGNLGNKFGFKGELAMDDLIFRQARKDEMPRILAMQADIFHGEQGIPADDIDTFLAKKPICWCAKSKIDGKIYAATAAWQEDNETHWGRFVVFPAARGKHIGTKLAKVSFDELFDMGIEKIYMDARDTTVRIVCGMGGHITGESYKFYEGNVTPVVLEKRDYVRTA